MTAAHFCPQCGKPLSSDAPQGLCPACLLKAALPGQSVVESGTTALHDSPPTTNGSEAGVRVKYFGDYELLEEIARGGMGVVWKARQMSLNRDVALKMIRAGALASPEEVQRFLREAEAAANLQHPNIVAIHEVGEHDGQHYFTMDYVSGRDLGALVKDGPLSPQRAARYVKIIAEAIHFAHQRGTLHRDLKPQNVLIDAADQPRITDFGLAKIMKDDSRVTQVGVAMGTPSYMPPEQAAGRVGDVGPASDVYSLGAVLYELLTGRPPFRRATPLATLRAVMEDEPAAPRRLLGTIPPDLETICLKCLEKSMSARYPTALAEELDRFLKGEPIQARPASAVRKAVSWARRHPGTLLAAAALVMVALAFGVFYLFEENALLRAQQADPSLTRISGAFESGKWKVENGVVALARPPGPLHESLQLWTTINLCALFAACMILLLVEGRARGLSFHREGESFKEWVVTWLGHPARPVRPPQPLGARTRSFAIGAGLILVGCGVMLLVTAIQAHVWEGEEEAIAWWVSQFPVIYFPIYSGLAILGMVIRDYRLIHYGLSSRQLTTEQIEPIRRAMEDYDVSTAEKLYREVVPDAGRDEAYEYVICLAESQRALHPGKFVPTRLPPLSRAKLVLIAAVIEAVVLGVWWAVFPPSELAWTALKFGCAFLLGMGLMASLCVKGVWKRTLMLVPAIILVTVPEVISASLADGPTWSVEAYIFGILFGGFLIIFGVRPFRKGERSER